MSDLNKLNERIFANYIKEVLEKMIEQGISKLDPKEFRNLYIKKVYKYQGDIRARIPGGGTMASKSVSQTLLNNGSYLET